MLKKLIIPLLTVMTMDAGQDTYLRDLIDSYETYKLKNISSPKLKQTELAKHIDTLVSALIPMAEMKRIGLSSEGRPITLVKIGNGKKKILLWSQMHGDEPTATMALLDILSYFVEAKNRPEVKTILSQTTLLMIPMLNPDGAERYKRRSVHGIDINRDALNLQTKEARLLKHVRDSINADFGFNLHDQDPRMTVGPSRRIAAIALLAPSPDSQKTDTPARKKAKSVAASLVDIMENLIPGHIAKYDDAFEPRAFGDNIQRWGTSTVLIESGGWFGDPEKAFLRKVNAVALLGVFHRIATDSYLSADVSRYERLPENTKNLCDLIIRRITLKYPSGIDPVTVDIGINIDPPSESNGTSIARVAELGDLRTFASPESIDAGSKTIEAALVELDRVVDLVQLKELLKK